MLRLKIKKVMEEEQPERLKPSDEELSLNKVIQQKLFFKTIHRRSPNQQEKCQI